jgi:hypothetical protein
MGKLILRNNGKETQLVNGQDFTSITPETDKYVLGFDAVTGNLDSLDPFGNIIQYGEGGTFTGGTVSGATTFTNGLTANTITVDTISATTYLNISAGGLTNTDYSGLTSLISTSGLTAGSYYLITDFQTCYDQPDFDYDGNPITSGNSKQGPVEPLMVFATSVNTISSDAYQPTYPNDKIKYDWTFSATEVTNNVSFGRITERVDEFNNRTDYDHRVVLFRRYENYYYKEKDIAKGTIELIQNTGEVIGIGTEFSNYGIGDYIAIPNSNGVFFEIVSISADTSMVVSGLTIPAVLSGSSFYSAQKDGLTYKQNNISVQYTEHPTFLFGNETIISNYIGDVASFIDWGGNTFLLPNNVFGEDVIGNRIGNDFRNNTFNSDVEHNVIGDQFENNTIYNDEDFTDNQIATNFRNNLIICDDFNDNVIGDNCNNNKIFNNIDFLDNQIGVGFNDNTIYNDFEVNKIGNGFYDNIIDGDFNDNSIGNQFNNNEIFSQFYDNLIANEFYNNTVYSRFYKNEILDNFNDNVIGDFGNLADLEFYRNYIRNNFNSNTIKNDYQNNQIGTNFQDNTINGQFIGNTILNGFNNNTIGDYFAINNIGNAFNNNTINDDFRNNTTDYYFNNNKISNDFYYNKLGVFFEANKYSNDTLVAWDDLSTVSARTYNTFFSSVGNNGLGNRVLGKEFIMFVTSTSQYFKIKFTQWTQGGNGGGFQYTREEINSAGNSLGPIITFTKTNNGNEVDVIVPGIIEITRGNQNGIYNVVSEGSWNGNLSPSGTTWNSIYTQSNNGERFAYNKIGNNFRNNTIGSDFGYGGGDPYGNTINDNFENNTIGQFAYNNVIGNEFKNNEIGNNFENNQIKNYFINNGIGDNFESNIIGDYFGNDASFSGTPVQNLISSGFKYNKIGDYFGNNLNYPTDGAGSGGDGGNIIASDFQNNVIGNNTIMNIFGTGFTGNKIGDYLSLNSFGDTAQDNVIGNYFTGNGGIGGYPNQIGNDFTSNKIGNYAVYNQIDEFRFNEIGNLFGNSNTNSGNIIYNAYNNKIGERFGYSFGNTIYSDFFDNLIGNNFYNNFIGEPSISSFRRNDIGNDFRENIVYSEFQNNEIGNQFNNNICGDEFVKNTIGNGFNNNKLSYFDTNKIGDGANNNVINDGFNNNIIGGYFSNNRISDANSNNIGANFSNNRFGSGFGFYDTSDVTSRNYDNFKDALDGNIGNYIIGRELIMLDTINNEYYSFVFTKWTQGGNGGGFKYSRQLVYPSSGPTVIFERPDYSASTIDVIIPGVLEIKRDDNGGGIYNVAVEGSFNGSVSPTNTTWNSNFTSSNRGSDFDRNRIGNEFFGNEIIGSNFSLNDISNLFRYNENIGNDFRKNIIKSEVQSVDFSTATYVYSNYNCEVFENSSNNNRLSYYDGSDVLNIVNITD